MPNIFLAADHAGFSLKEELLPFIASLGYEIEDCGATALDTEDDYPDIIRPCAEKVVANQGSFGIVIGASGQGEAMVANRISGARAAVYYGNAGKEQTDASGATLDLLASTRAHNNANILSLGARFISTEEAKEAVRVFLSTPFSREPRHVRRVEKFG